MTLAISNFCPPNDPCLKIHTKSKNSWAGQHLLAKITIWKPQYMIQVIQTLIRNCRCHAEGVAFHVTSSRTVTRTQTVGLTVDLPRKHQIMKRLISFACPRCIIVELLGKACIPNISSLGSSPSLQLQPGHENTAWIYAALVRKRCIREGNVYDRKAGECKNRSSGNRGCQGYLCRRQQTNSSAKNSAQDQSARLCSSH